MIHTRVVLAFVSVLLAWPASAFTDTSSLLGAEYTPARAPGNSMWWAHYDEYAADIDRELAAAKKHLRFTTLRMFLHTQVYAADKQGLITNMARFLNTASTYGMRVGWVFFGDCWVQNGGNVSTPCVPTKGVHNGCWMASPQKDERTSIDRFESYVTHIITAFKDDKRVAWWEIYNEPHPSNAKEMTGFSYQLRDAGYRWAKAILPSAPIIACWDDSNNTDIVDHHQYSANWGSNNQVLSNPTKGGLITEGGSRWYQNNLIGDQNDQGSPLVVLNWLQGLKAANPARPPFIPGVIMNWALMVGNDNTRWHWGSKPGTREPVVPWDAWLFPDGTPVSYTEAGAMRRWVTQATKEEGDVTADPDDFLHFDSFMEVRSDLTDDQFLSLKGDRVWHARLSSSRLEGQLSEAAAAKATLGDGIYETSIWPNSSSSIVYFVVKSVNATASAAGLQAIDLGGYAVGVHMTGAESAMLIVERWEAGGSKTVLGSYNASAPQMECGVVVGSWNILRVLVQGGKLSVWLNTMWTDTQGQHTANGGEPVPPAPRLVVSDPSPAPLPPGGLAIATQHDGTNVDYVGVLPESAL